MPSALEQRIGQYEPEDIQNLHDKVVAYDTLKKQYDRIDTKLTARDALNAKRREEIENLEAGIELLQSKLLYGKVSPTEVSDLNRTISELNLKKSSLESVIQSSEELTKKLNTMFNGLSDKLDEAEDDMMKTFEGMFKETPEEAHDRRTRNITAGRAQRERDKKKEEAMEEKIDKKIQASANKGQTGAIPLLPSASQNDFDEAVRKMDMASKLPIKIAFTHSPKVNGPIVNDTNIIISMLAEVLMGDKHWPVCQGRTFFDDLDTPAFGEIPDKVTIITHIQACLNRAYSLGASKDEVRGQLQKAWNEFANDGDATLLIKWLEHYDVLASSEVSSFVNLFNIQDNGQMLVRYSPSSYG